MSPPTASSEILAKVESAVRSALREIQRGNVLCVPKRLEERQLEGAVRTVMRQLVKECPELAVKADQQPEKVSE